MKKGAVRNGMHLGMLRESLAVVLVLGLSCVAAALAAGRDVYVANSGDDDVSVIDAATNTKLGADIGVGAGLPRSRSRPTRGAPMSPTRPATASP